MPPQSTTPKPRRLFCIASLSSSENCDGRCGAEAFSSPGMLRAEKKLAPYSRKQAPACSGSDSGKKYATTVPPSLTANATKKRSRSASKVPVPFAPSLTATASSLFPPEPVAEDLPVSDVISLLELQPHPEGGFYRRT
jgi:hypothetical protein